MEGGTPGEKGVAPGVGVVLREKGLAPREDTAALQQSAGLASEGSRAWENLGKLKQDPPWKME